MLLVLISSLISFFVVYLLTPFFINYFKKIGLVSKDVHKPKKPFVPISAGIPLIFGISLSIFFYVFWQTFLVKNYQAITYLFASLLSIILIAFVGFLDDLNVKQVKKGKWIEGKEGLKRWQKPLATLIAVFPLMVVMAGHSQMDIPFIGSVDFGIFYPLIIVPIGIFGAANMVNMLGGFNGLEAGMGLVYTFSLGIYALIHQSYLASLIFFSTFFGLLGIIKYNWYPAKILAGDSLTYLLGAVLAIGAIIGNMEKATVITAMPFIIQGILKFYSKIKLGDFASDLGIFEKNGKIRPKYKEIYSLTHLATRIAKTEKKIVLFLIFIQVIFSLIPFLGII